MLSCVYVSKYIWLFCICVLDFLVTWENRESALSLGFAISPTWYQSFIVFSILDFYVGIKAIFKILHGIRARRP
jgi:hypothetical protein